MLETDSSTTRWLRAGAVTSLIAIAFQETVDFSLQMPANAALFAVVCAIALHGRPQAAAADRPADVNAPVPRGDGLLRLVRGSRDGRKVRTDST
jgi:hypothetical protein